MNDRVVLADLRRSGEPLVRRLPVEVSSAGTRHGNPRGRSGTRPIHGVIGARCQETEEDYDKEKDKNRSRSSGSY